MSSKTGRKERKRERQRTESFRKTRERKQIEILHWKSIFDPGTVDAQILQHCRKALRERALSKAASALRSTSVATVTRDVLVKMNLLHPDGASIPMLNTPPQFGSDDDVTHSMLRKCILSFPPLSAAGPSGLKPFYLNDILRHTTAEQQTQFLESIKRFVLKALRGELSPNARIYLCSARLLPFT